MPVRENVLPYAINDYVCPAAMDYLDFLDRVAAHGFSGIGLTRRALDEMPTHRLKHEIAARNLTVTSIGTAGFFLAEDGADQRARNLKLLDQAAELETGGLTVIVGGTGGMPLAQARAVVRAGMAEFSRHADSSGVTLYLEPLHPLNAVAKSCVNTIAQAEGEMRGLPGMLLNLDTFHLWWDPDFDRFIDDPASRLGILQISDTDFGAADALPRRLPLCEGALDWRDIVKRVRAGRPDIPIELELFADQLQGRDPDELLRTATRAFRALEEA